MWAFWVKASFYKDNTTLKEIKDGQLAASLFLFIKINKPNKNKHAQVLSPPFGKKKKKGHLHAGKVKVPMALKSGKMIALFKIPV